MRRTRALRPSLYQVYVTVVGIAICGVLTGHVIASAVGPGLSAQTLGRWGPGVALLVLLTAVRSGAWQGPVAFSPADVAFLLAAPIALIDLVRPRLGRVLAAGGVLGLLAGAVVVLASATGFSGAGAARTIGVLVAFTSLGLVAVAGSWLVERSLRLTRYALAAGIPVAMLAAALVGVGSIVPGGREVAIWSGPWGWALAPLAGTSGWPLAVALEALLAALTVGLALRRSASAHTERFLAQAQTRARISASVLSLDSRSAALAGRTATGGGPHGPSPRGALSRLRARSRVRVPRPRRSALTLLWRDALAATRAPSRIAWGLALCAAGTLEAVTHPGRPLPALIAALAMYVAAGRLLEPLRVEVDAPETSRLLLSWEFGRVLVAHCVLPVILLLGAASAAIVVIVGAGGAGVAVLAVIPTVLAPVLCCAVLCVALAARRGGRVGDSVLMRVLSSATMDPMGGVSAIVWLAPWLLLEIVVVALPLLLIGHAAAHHRPVLTAGLWAGVLTVAVAGALLRVARSSRAQQ